MRVPIAPVVALLAGSSVVLALFVARGFVLGEHTRIIAGALAVGWLLGFAWTLTTAAEQGGGWKRLGVAGALGVLLATLVAAFAPLVLLALWVGAHVR